VNARSGAGGLFQLLSPGYRQRAQQLGGIQNPRANALAILPDYQRYWRQHPGAAPGEAGRDVERSGAGAGFYSRGLSQLGNLGGGPTPAPSPAQAPPGAPATPGPQQTGLALIQALQPGPQHNDFSGVFQAVQQRAQAHAQQLAQHVELAPGIQKVPRGSAQIVQLAQKYVGTPYKWGGTTPKGFDCSGFAQYVYAHAGVRLPRTTYEQWRIGAPVSRGQLREGDLVFFHRGPRGPEHEGIYVGNGQMLVAPHTGAVVRFESINQPGYMGGRRVG
jgi:cell wall-associated NlpC family hydrolase